MEHLTPREYRCANCNKLLFKGVLLHALVEIKCRGCKKISAIKSLTGDLAVMDGDDSYKNSNGDAASINKPNIQKI